MSWRQTQAAEVIFAALDIGFVAKVAGQPPARDRSEAAKPLVTGIQAWKAFCALCEFELLEGCPGKRVDRRIARRRTRRGTSLSHAAGKPRSGPIDGLPPAKLRRESDFIPKTRG